MSEPRVVVDAGSGLAPWRQVHDQLVALITSGALPPGAKLPTIRQLAGDLGLAAGTIARTYRELEAEGWVATGRGRGTVAAERAQAPDPVAALHGLARDYAARARNLGADADTAARAVYDEYGEG